MAFELKFPDTIKTRIENGKIIEQKIWSFIKELNSFDNEHLDAVAIYDGSREYTYRQMFRKWELYAEVFSALEITEKNQSCVGLLPDYGSEPLFAIYALNMTGASVSILHHLDYMDARNWGKIILKEGITDIVLSDTMMTPEMLESIAGLKEKDKVRNIIVLHNSGRNAYLNQAVYMKRKENYRKLKKIKNVLFMKDLLEKYEAYPITFSSKKLRDDAIVLHTSGTTNGVHKPVPLSDRGFNEATARMLRAEMFHCFKNRIVCVQALVANSAYSLIDMIHLPFSFGGKVITLPYGLYNPLCISALKQYHVNIFFGLPAVMDRLIKLPVKLDLSDVEFVFVGGAYTSIEQKKKYNSFLKKSGSKARISIGYGASEVGGAAILSSPDSEDDSMGLPLPGINVKIYDENEQKYYNLEDGPRTGVLMISSPSVSCGKLNDIEFFKLEDIDGEKYLNTYDLVRVNENGTMNYIGRMNKFFVNNEGIRFDAGLVETAVNAEPAIEACGLAPMYDKMLHDTVPVLYVQTNVKGKKGEEAVKDAIKKVFITDGRQKESNLPIQCVITDKIPYNESGKVDIYRIKLGEGRGIRFDIKPVRKEGKITDIKFVQVEDKDTDRRPDALGVFPEELKEEMKLHKKYFKNYSNNPMMPGQGGFSMPGVQNMSFGLGIPQILAFLQDCFAQMTGYPYNEK